MRNQSKIAIAFLTLMVGLPLAFGQNPAPGAGPQPLAGKDGPAMHDRMHRAPVGNRGQRGPMQARWSHARRMRMHRQFMLARLVRNPSIRARLGVTPEQALKIRTQTSDFRKTQIRNRAELQVKHLELHDLMSADKPDRGAIDKKLQEISAVGLARARSAIDFRLAMREALTPDQREKLREMRAEFFRQRGPGHQGPHGPMGEAPSPDA